MDEQITTNQATHNSASDVPTAVSSTTFSSTPLPKNTKNKPNWIFLLIVILLLAGSGILVFSTYKKENTLVEPAIVVEQQSSPGADSFVDWQLYQGNGFSFKHPKEVEIYTETAGKNTDNMSVAFIGPTQKASGRTQTELYDGYSFSVAKVGAVIETSTSEWAAKERMQNVDACSHTDPLTGISEVQTIVLAGHTAYQFTSVGCYADFTSTYMDDGTNVYRITQLYTGTPDVYENYKKNTDKILSTFTFTTQAEEIEEENETSSLPSETIAYSPKADWQTYVDEVAGFQIQYATDHKLGDGEGSVVKGQSVNVWNCWLRNPQTGQQQCAGGFTIHVYNDYDGGSRRAWLNNKSEFYKPYYMDWMIGGRKSLVAIDGNTGGSSWMSVAIPHESKMFLFSVNGVAWDPETGKLPDLSYQKNILSTFKIL